MRRKAERENGRERGTKGKGGKGKATLREGGLKGVVKALTCSGY